MNRTDTVEIELWYTANSTFHMNCFAWCGTLQDIQKVKGKANSSINSNGLKALNFSRLETRETVDISALADPVLSLSPYRVYRLVNSELIDNDQSTCTKYGICQRTSRLEWNGRVPCQLNMHCRNVSSNVCADYGLYAQFKQDRVLDICYGETQATVPLEAGDSVIVEAWWARRNQV